MSNIVNSKFELHLVTRGYTDLVGTDNRVKVLSFLESFSGEI